MMRWIRYLSVLLLLNLLCLKATVAETPQLLASLSQPASRVSHSSAGHDVEAALMRLNLRLQSYPYDYEASLLKSMVYFNLGNVEQALGELDALLERAPDFHLAHLVRGDMLLSRVRPVAEIGRTPVLQALSKDKQPLLDALRQEARVRLQAQQSRTSQTRVPRQILGLGESVNKALLVDKRNHRLYIFERQGSDAPPRLVRDYYVSTGKKEGNKFLRGDLRTPEGVYFVTSWIPQEKLPDKYGVGAFPVNYPNEWDRRLGKTGYGIWLHGTDSNSYSRPPLDSEGCMVLTNLDLNTIKKEITPGVTPVVITEQVDWIDVERWRRERDSVLSAIEAWRLDWESLDVDRYLSHYASSFWSKSHDFQSWSKRKRRLAKNKSFQKVSLSDISLLAYPQVNGENKDMVVVRFHQSYQSDNFNSDMNKRLYLQRSEKKWRIMYEGR